MNVPEITEVKNHLEELKRNNLISNWELPYENLLTRRSAAIFFISTANEATLAEVCQALEKYENFSWRQNTEKKLSQLDYRVTFSKEEKEKNTPKEQEVV